MASNPPTQRELKYDGYINSQRFKNRNESMFKSGTKYRVDLKNGDKIIAELAFISNEDKKKFIGFHANSNQ